MKTLFTILFLCLFISFSSYAQLSKGNWLVGGGFSLSNTNSSDPDSYNNYANKDKHASISAMPIAGIFVSNRWVVGLRPSINYRKYSNDYDSFSNESTNTSYGLNLIARYYQPINERFNFFVHLTGIGYSLGRVHNIQKYSDDWNGNSSYDNKYRQNSYQLGAFASPGITYFLTKKIGLEATIGSIGYGYTKTKTKPVDVQNAETSTREDWGGELSFLPNSFSLGLMFYLGK